MADLKISQLSPASYAASADLFNIVQGGINKKLTTANLFANIKSSVIFNPASESLNLRMLSPNDSHLFYLDETSDNIGISTNNPQEKLDIDGNLNIGSTWNSVNQTGGGFLRINGTDTLNATGTNNPLNLLTAVTKIVPNGSTTGTIGPGVEGQIKQIFLASNQGTFRLDMTASGGAGFASALFDSIGDSLTLQYLGTPAGGKWFIVASNGINIT